MPFFILLLLSSLTFVNAETKLSLSAGLIYSNPDTNDLNDSTVSNEQSGLGGGLGLRALMVLKDQLHFRSGAGIIQKKFSYETNEAGSKKNHDFSLVYLNLPLTLYWRASSQVGLFAGSALHAKLSDDCPVSGESSSCTKDKVQAIVFPAIVGFDFYLMSKLGLELSYEYGLTETAKNLSVHSAAISFLYHLD